MNILNMTEEDIKSTLRIVSAVLHFGNMEFKKERGNDQATMPDNTVAQKVCQLLRLDINNFTRALLRPKIKVIILLFDVLSLQSFFLYRWNKKEASWNSGENAIFRRFWRIASFGRILNGTSSHVMLFAIQNSLEPVIDQG